jgi:hypothetical protein
MLARQLESDQDGAMEKHTAGLPDLNPYVTETSRLFIRFIA